MPKRAKRNPARMVKLKPAPTRRPLTGRALALLSAHTTREGCWCSTSAPQFANRACRFRGERCCGVCRHLQLQEGCARCGYGELIGWVEGAVKRPFFWRGEVENRGGMAWGRQGIICPFIESKMAGVRWAFVFVREQLLRSTNSGCQVFW
ncbi:uncharacterized protein B0H64DRAFT_386413 [Chaetomium fimeti]|uniref:Uncharacterized protein n=1 Tax=Chaetomium fimeti TaxID=1854472 RepID=A0AAE0HLN4_9PEZI|nr:hypothetical protein B0H64DRAFT_386413 [Chaetomium fimeti]